MHKTNCCHLTQSWSDILNSQSHSNEKFLNLDEGKYTIEEKANDFKKLKTSKLYD